MNKPHMNEEILKDLQGRYQKATLTKEELAHELSMAVSTISGYIVKGYGIPEYIKVGEGIKGKVLFPVVNVVNYLSNTVKVA